MKPIISYGLIGHPASRLRVVGITSETKGARARIYGRTLDDRVTNASSRACYGRFDTQELAEQARAAVQQVFDRHREGVQHAYKVWQQLERGQFDAVRDALAALPALPIAALEAARP